MKTNRLCSHKQGYCLLIFLILTLLACGKKNTAVPASEQLKKVWTAQYVTENTATVYNRGAASNIRNYSAFRLDLSNSPTVSFTDYDGVVITGQYDVPIDTHLVLKSLTPQPTGTGGTIEFTINSISATELMLTRTSANAKTGSSNNQYTLTNP